MFVCFILKKYFFAATEKKNLEIHFSDLPDETIHWISFGWHFIDTLLFSC